MGAELGSYVEYPASKKDLLAVLRLHNAAQKLAIRPARPEGFQDFGRPD